MIARARAEDGGGAYSCARARARTHEFPTNASVVTSRDSRAITASWSPASAPPPNPAVTYSRIDSLTAHPTRSHTHTHTHTHARAHTHTRTNKRTHTRKHKRKHTCTQCHGDPLIATAAAAGTTTTTTNNNNNKHHHKTTSAELKSAHGANSTQTRPIIHPRHHAPKFPNPMPRTRAHAPHAHAYARPVRPHTRRAMQPSEVKLLITSITSIVRRVDRGRQYITTHEKISVQKLICQAGAHSR
jgi:hypothetical protein